MIKKLLSLLVTIVKIPIKIALLPFKIVSSIMKIIITLAILAVVGGAVYFVVL
ncbi:MAG: hypothetical protein ABEH77_06700 [Halobacteriaceae archaeon]